MAETDKHRGIVSHYCEGNGVDLGSSGAPVVPWAIQLDLPPERVRSCQGGKESHVHYLGDARELPFRDRTLDWVHASHVIEDFKEWGTVLAEWDRVLKPGGYLMIAVPDHARFRAAVLRGQGDNLAHKHESYPGELTALLKERYEVIYDNFVSDDPLEYSVLFVGRKKR